MAETPKSFWGKLNKTNLRSTPIPSQLPIDLLQMFPSMNASDLYHVYHHQCNDSISQTASYLTRDQPSDHLDYEIPIETIIESLNDVTIHPTVSKNNCGPDYFKQTPTHVLSHIFSFNGPMSWGKMTTINRECRLIAKGLLARIRIYDFSFFYHDRCHLGRSHSYKKSGRSRLVHDDQLRLISYINAFPDLEKLTLRNTHFTKWSSFQSLINGQSITYLNLGRSLNLYDDDIALMMECFPNLSTLDLSHCFEISDLALTHIIECEMENKLQSLYLNHIPFITTNGVQQLLKYKKCIVDLEWKGSKYGNLFKAFEFGNAVHLQSLNVSGALSLERLELTMAPRRGTAIGNGLGFDALHSLHSLELNLSNCHRLKIVDLDIAHLSSLDVTQCQRLTTIRISNAFQLRTLQCRYCKVLETVAVPADTVQMMGFTGCSALNLEVLLNDGNALMSSLKKGALKALDLSHVQHLETENVEEILSVDMKHGKGLKALSVAECKLIPKPWMESLHKRFARPRTKSTRMEKKKQRMLDRKNRTYSS